MTTNATVVVDAPEVSLAEGEQAGVLLLHFFRKLGWNGMDFLNPCKIRTTQEVYDSLHKKMYERYSDTIVVGMFMVKSGPGVDNFIPQGKVHLLEGWITPASEEGETTYAA